MSDTQYEFDRTDLAGILGGLLLVVGNAFAAGYRRGGELSDVEMMNAIQSGSPELLVSGALATLGLLLCLAWILAFWMHEVRGEQ